MLSLCLPVGLLLRLSGPSPLVRRVVLSSYVNKTILSLTTERQLIINSEGFKTSTLLSDCGVASLRVPTTCLFYFTTKVVTMGIVIVLS